MTTLRQAYLWLAIASLPLIATDQSAAQAPPETGSPAVTQDVKEAGPELAPLSAPAAVREGNRRLLAGSPAEALQAYRHAETLAPDAREVAFVEGLAHYDLKEFDDARRAFERAAGSQDDALADDALYSLATCDHAEALEKNDNPQEALGLLESAMNRYRNLLEHRPDHAAARDANFKAAAMWRQLKQLMEQQQQQQQSGEQNEQEQDEQQQDQQQQGDQQQQDQQEQQQQSEDQSQKQQQQQEQEGEQDQQQQSAQQQQQQQDQEEQAAQAKPDEQEQVSREQAERKLREMMQALRDREKARRQQVERPPVRPVDKDW